MGALKTFFAVEDILDELKNKYAERLLPEGIVI